MAGTWWLSLMLLAVLLAACQSSPPATTATVPASTATPIATPTATSVPTPVATPMPTATATPVPTPTSPPTPTPKPTLSPIEVAAARLTQLLPWYQDPPDDAHADAARALTQIQVLDDELAKTAAALAWVTDRITAEELGALSYLADIAAQDTEAVFSPAVQQVANVWRQDPGLGATLSEIPWIADGVTGDEPADLDNLVAFAMEEPTLANLLLASLWVAGPLTTDERQALEIIRSLATEDRGLTELLLGYSWLMDDINEPEWRGLHNIRLLRQRRGPDSATQVANYPWIADGMSRTDRSAIASLGRIGDAAPLLAQLVQGYSWVGDDLTGEELDALRGILSLVKQGPELVGDVLRYPWVTDGLTPQELPTLERIGELTALDHQFAVQVIGLPWLVDDLTEHEGGTLGYLLSLAQLDRELAGVLLTYPWVADGITEIEQNALHDIANLREQSPELRPLLVNLPWLSDDVTEEEAQGLTELRKIADQDPGAAAVVMAATWVMDGITNAEAKGIQDVGQLYARDGALAHLVLDLPWVYDGINRREQQAIDQIGDLHNVDSELTDVLLGFSWMTDDNTAIERAVIRSFSALARQDPSLAARVLRYGWMADGVTGSESRAVSALSFIARKDPELAVRLAEAEFLDSPFRTRDGFAIATISGLLGLSKREQVKVTEQTWFTDGLSDDEAALLTVLPRIKRDSNTAYEDLIRQPFIQSKTITTPLAGQMDLVVIRDDPFPVNDGTLDLLEQGIKVSEDFMGVPFPKDDVIFLFVGVYPEILDFGGRYYSHYVIMSRFLYSFEGVTFHELGHYYLHSGPRWFFEGGANFLEAYVNAKTGRETLSDRKLDLANRLLHRYCYGNGIRNLQDLIDRAKNLSYQQERKQPWFRCHYNMGEYFLINVYETLGRQATASALRELYESRSPHPNEGGMYGIFLRNAPPDKQEDFKDMYRRIHGGPSVDQ